MMMRVRVWRRLCSGQGCLAVLMYVALIVTAANWFIAAFTTAGSGTEVAPLRPEKVQPVKKPPAAVNEEVEASTLAVYTSNKLRRRAVKSLPSKEAAGESGVHPRPPAPAEGGGAQVQGLPVQQANNKNNMNDIFNNNNNNNNNHNNNNNNPNNNNNNNNNPYNNNMNNNNNNLPAALPPGGQQYRGPVAGSPQISLNQYVNQQQQQQRQQQQQQQRPPGPYIVPDRIVHFDLKGAPPKPDYFVKLLTLIKEFGATGILVEWEDTFPYTGSLAPAVSGSAYTMADVEQILSAAHKLNLSIIPLVQTFGHLEWILKLNEFVHLRDVREFATVMCVAKPEAWQLLQEMVAQVAAVHTKYGMPYVHIGADEVFQVGSCAESSAKLAELGRSKERYMVWHIARMAKHIRDSYNGTSVLIWHDMIANMPQMELTNSGLHQLVEPVVWNYAEDIERYMSPMVWETLRPFGVVWGASAFKGADGPMRYHANPNHYVRNSQSWLRQISQHQAKYHPFKGIILTGWSRYDHFAVLAEIFPVATPSLVMCLMTISTGKSTGFASETQRLLGCPMAQTTGPTGRCNYTGYGVFQQVQSLRALRQQLPNDIYSDVDPGFEYNGWLGRMNLAQAFSSSWYLNKLLPKVRSYHQRIAAIYRQLERELLDLFYEDTVAEWLYEYVGPELERLSAVRQKAEAIRAQQTFPKRPLPGVVPQLEYLRQLVKEA